jgi:RNA polymerase sigma-70 factor (ECF subfamily)
MVSLSNHAVPRQAQDDAMRAIDAFTEHRPLLFGIAYRMLGSVMDAEDAVQETYMRWQQANDANVRSAKSYLSTIVTRHCIDQLRSARRQREQYIGPWLPEPLITDNMPELHERPELAESISMAFLVLLEALSPVERAVFLLRDVFDYEYTEIARIVDKGEANCRQMARRARQHVAERDQRFDVSRTQVEELMRHFLRAAAEGDMDALLSMLAEDATVWSDGGGKVAAALNPVAGAAKVARFFVGVLKKAPGIMEGRVVEVNGTPGVITYLDGKLYSILTLDMDGDRVRAVRVVNNPEKLRHLPQTAG